MRAPAAGRVLRVPERSERVVAAGAPLIELGDPRSLEIVVDVLSSDGALIHPGDRVRLAEWTSSDAGTWSQLGGHVREIEPSGFTKISALGVEEQRVNVIIDPDTLPASIGDGFRVEASIVVWSTPSATVGAAKRAGAGRADRRTDGDLERVRCSRRPARGAQRSRRTRRRRAGGGSGRLGGRRYGRRISVRPSEGRRARPPAQGLTMG